MTTKPKTLFLLKVYKDEEGKTKIRYGFDKEGLLGTFQKEGLKLAALIFARSIGAEIEDR